MKTTKIFSMMVTLTLLCASLTACAKATNPNQQQPVSQPTAEAQPEDNAGNVGIDSPDNSRAEKDKEAREELYPENESDSHKGNLGIESPDNSRAEKDKEAREELERQQEEQAHSGNGTYILSDGTEVHTDHWIEDYIERNEYYVKRDGVLTPKHEFILDIGKMCYDIFGSGTLEGAAGFDFEGGGVEFSEFDEKNLAHAITIEVRSAGGSSAYSIVKMFDCSMPANWLPDDEHTIKVGESYMHLDLAVLILYGLEQAEANPRWDIFADISFVSNYGSKDARRWQP